MMKNMNIAMSAIFCLAASCATPDIMPGAGARAVAFDYDNTCSATPDLCADFFRATHNRGMTPILLTARAEPLGGAVKDFAAKVEKDLGFKVPVVYSGGKRKSRAAADAGYDVVVICDDRSATPELKRMGVVYVCGASVPAPNLLERMQRAIF
jgi:hypothetical protein